MSEPLKPVEEPKYPPGVPSKFDSDGNAQHFPGNTVVSHLSPSSEPELYESMLALYDKLKRYHLSHLYALLPPSSWHMTVFEGVCDQVRVPGRWPDDLPIDASLQECTSLFENKLSSFDLQCDPPYRISVTGFDPLETGIGVHLEPSTPGENARIRGLRDRLSTLLHIRHKGHATYGLHLSMAYLLRILTEEQEKELRGLLMDHFNGMPKLFKLGAPEFCTFEDMLAFKRLFYLKNQ
ncbi:RNA ligase/cyclic nucleotide phosphodiesterase [Mycena albidolilacea]|uniref:RNA ligase/cyclic nucleotide phosphodiesterase n=1 Tax=Mycena albidolilacea TaxID=1033008 RepID=A0AAD7F4N2_9AGAR|nr:RNA ligase/cyclic nucleotide phosphodiesterase [Mycena albidolilacea]